jgi:hypothetical protein
VLKRVKKKAVLCLELDFVKSKVDSVLIKVRDGLNFPVIYVTIDVCIQAGLLVRSRMGNKLPILQSGHLCNNRSC